MMETVTLKDGTVEAEPMVKVMMFTLKSMLEAKPTDFYDFVMRCRDPKYEMWVSAEEELKRYGLLDANGQVHDSVRNIVLNAVVGDGLGMRLTSPIAEEPQP